MGKFCVGNRFRPRCGIIAAEDTKVGLDFLVDSFSFAVGLWVIGSREGEVIVQEFSKFSSKGGCELRAPIRDYFVEKSKAKEDFVEKEGGDSFGGDGFLGRAKNHPLSKPMVDHDQERIEARGDREICNKIAGNLLEGARSDRFDG